MSTPHLRAGLPLTTWPCWRRGPTKSVWPPRFIPSADSRIAMSQRVVHRGDEPVGAAIAGQPVAAKIGHERESDVVLEVGQSYRTTGTRMTEDGRFRRFGYHEVL